MQDAEVDEVIKRVNRAAERVEKMAEGGNRNTTRIEINAGGVGVWLATTCCFVMMALNAALLFTVAGHDRKIERLEDYLQAIYTQAPHLKPDENGRKTEN